MVKRYTLGRMPAYENNVREFDMVESPHGDFVTLSDYRTVAERCEMLETALRRIAGHGREITGAPDMIAIASSALGLSETVK